MPPRHFSRYIFLGAVLLIGIIIIPSTSRAPQSVAGDLFTYPEGLRGAIPKFNVPSFRFSFQHSAHRPPEQKNSTHDDSSWYSDWKWLNPFSSSVTLDEERIVLPPLAERSPVYTFYDSTIKRDEATRKADKELLLTWRRAWWAHGFRPVILTEAEAMSHPLYQTLHSKGMPAALEQEFRQWLAWGHMGTGMLSSWYCLPMGAYDDPLLSHLRRGQYTHLTKFEGLGSGLFAGEQSQVNDAIKAALDSVKLSSFKSIVDAIDSERFKTEKPTSIAHYDSQTITHKYPVLAEQLVQDPNKGRLFLNQLITAHLHTIWQNTFSTGITVLQPLAAHTFGLVKPSMDLARLLAECPSSILQSSCPPNRPKCSPCVGSKLRINTAPSFRNTSSLFTIAVVPHPYTMITLTNQSDTISVAHIRRHTERDPWISAVTRDLLGDARGGPSRVVSLKDAVASEYGSSRSLWFTTEHFPASFNPPLPPPKSPTNDAHPAQEKVAPFPEDWLEHLDWHFGFPVPRTVISHGESLPPVPGPERWATSPAGLPAERKKGSDPDPPTDEQAAIEDALIRKARETINSKDQTVLRIRSVAEAWNMADTEAWKFVKSYRARQVVERLKFEEEESAYETGEGVRGYARWWGS
ncbi:uncharacterized protein Z518_04336 [Rhinocladiella mackenziei CBS 650.93]|uniref:Uncharacterized protein n=1 Tax=Rhinocladiella mackenziei CBS 650.93 TaxID=1442369 RepID=A0A0D2JB77_9EURO|nr:uncharacterized protein Z518_04336 [Rhinocladiella mackenziei CBS 650.93]KIX06360.1 hypothetical protein Z518_04336 [Rhinocladiella mackenziei CBS 650.93]